MKYELIDTLVPFYHDKECTAKEIAYLFYQRNTQEQNERLLSLSCDDDINRHFNNKIYLPSDVARELIVIKSRDNKLNVAYPKLVEEYKDSYKDALTDIQNELKNLIKNTVKYESYDDLEFDYNVFVSSDKKVRNKTLTYS